MRRPEFDPAWPAEIVEIWRNDMREIWDPTIERHSFHCYQNQLDTYVTLAERVSAGTALDVGCAQGTLALLLAERGVRVTAVDMRRGFLEYARSRWERGSVDFLTANVMDEPDLGTFDIVFANQIIEHLVYPDRLLRILGRYLSPHGLLVVTTPNHSYFRNSLPTYTALGDPSAYEHRQFTAGGGDHFFAFTESELRRSGAVAGLRTAEVRYLESPWISGHVLLRHLHGRLPLSVLRSLDRLTLSIAPRRTAHQLMVLYRRKES